MPFLPLGWGEDMKASMIHGEHLNIIKLALFQVLDSVQGRTVKEKGNSKDGLGFPRAHTLFAVSTCHPFFFCVRT